MSDKLIPTQLKFHDEQLQILARSFADLPEIEWTAGPIINGETRAQEVLEAKQARHVCNIPNTDIYCARFVFRQTRVYLAYCKGDRLDDLMRFADVLTFRLWGYRQRGAHTMREGLFNFSIRDATVDLEEWTCRRPDIVDLINQLVARLEELDLIQLPSQRMLSMHKAGVHSLSRTRTVAGKVESVMAYNHQLLETLLDEKILAMQNLYAATCKEIACLQSRFDRIEKMITDQRDGGTSSRPHVDTSQPPPADSENEQGAAQ